MPAGLSSIVLDLLAVRPSRVQVLKDVPDENGSWLLELPDRERLVVRRYHEDATREGLGYEHDVIRYLAQAGWVVPAPVGDLVRWEDRWYCLTHYVPGHAAIGAEGLPLMVIHGDFAEWNVHYHRDRLAGVIDFGLTHLDSRPYELAIARTWRAPAALDAYRAELARLDWALSDLEEAAVRPLYHAFRLDQIAWSITYGLRTGEYDLAAIERGLSRTGTRPP